MRKVYEADSYIDAQITRGWLEAAGVPVLLAGEHLGGGIGELPVAGLLSLWVGDAFELEARAALAELAAQRDQGVEAADAAANDDGPLIA